MNFIKAINFKEVKRPLKMIFATSLGSKNVLKSIIISVKLDNGIEGKGECPTSFVSPHEDIDSIKKILKNIIPNLLNTPIDTYMEKVLSWRNEFKKYPMTVSGLEVALFRAYLKNRGIGEYQNWGEKLYKIETDITIPFITENESLRRWLKYAFKNKFRIFKIKVSGDVEKDMDILTYIYEILSDSMEGFSIRLDGNQGFTAKTLLRFSEQIEKKGYKIELFEQPIAKYDYKAMKAVRKRMKFPIILDESVFNSQDLMFAITEDICDGINIKIAKSGILESKKIMEISRKNHIKLMIGCMTETMTGLSAGIYMATGTGGFDFIDLDSIHYVHHRNIYDHIHIEPPFFCIHTR